MSHYMDMVLYIKLYLGPINTMTIMDLQVT